MFRKLTTVALLSTLAVAAGFAPGIVGRHANPLFMSEDTKMGTVKWWVLHMLIQRLVGSANFSFHSTHLLTQHTSQQ
jgi:hypothetical protein